MKTVAKKIIRPASPAEVLTALTKSLAFQVQMIMWEDRKNGRAGSGSLIRSPKERRIRYGRKQYDIKQHTFTNL